MGEEIVFGIDLGTTNSCMAAAVNGEVRIIHNTDGENTTPSMVAFINGERIVGKSAKKSFATKNGNKVIYDCKRMIGRSFDDPNLQKYMKMWPFQVINSNNNPLIRVEDKKIEFFKPEEICAMILKKLKDDATAYFGQEIKKAVITVPANFDVTQKQVTMDAGKLAGLEVMKLLVEPTAAAIAYGFHKKTNVQRHILVYDLGGGTFDVSILKVKGNDFEVLATGGDMCLGGQDFDNILAENILKNHRDKIDGNNKNEALIRRRLVNKCENAKKMISTAENAIIYLDSLFDNDDDDKEIEVSRGRFQYYNKELFERTITIVKKTLQEINFTTDSIDEVVLVGGSTRIPKIQELLKELFDGKTLQRICNPDEDIARGAALYAETLMQGSDDEQDFKTVRELRSKFVRQKTMYLKDVLPISIGIADYEGKMVKIIKKNSKYPTEKMQSWMTTYDNQACMIFDIYEGEHDDVSENKFLGQLKLENFPMKRKGEIKFDTTLAIDINGILNVSAVERSMKLSIDIKISFIGGRMKPDEFKRFDAEEEKYREAEERRAEIGAKKSELEGFCINVITKINRLTPDEEDTEKHIMMDECEKTLKWIDHERQFDMKQLNTTLSRLKLICRSVNDS